MPYIDDDEIVRDGQSVKVPMTIMDSRRPVSFDAAAHQPGFRSDTASYLEAYRRSCADVALPSGRVSDADVRAARSAWIEDTTSAWKADARKKKPPDDDGDDDDDDDDNRGSSLNRNKQSDSRDDYVKRLTDAWRTPVRDAAQPDMGTRPEDPAAAQARRDRIYADYRTSLSNAWRSGPGAAPAQTAIVGVGPKSMVEEPARGRTDPARAGEVEEVYEKTLGK